MISPRTIRAFKNLITASIFIFIVCLSIQPAYAQSGTQPFSLKTGFNFVSLTLTPSSSITELMTQQTELEDIYLYSAAAGSFLSVSDSSLTSISAGKGYIFKTKSDITFDLAGTALSTINDINLKTGFNLTGFSKVPETITCSQLLAKFAAIKGIYSWSPNAGTFIQVVRNSTGVIEKLDGADPTITAGKSYFINLTQDVTLNYDGSSILFSGGEPQPDITEGVTDISISTFAKKAVLAINTSGLSAGLETQAVGILPQSVNNPSRMIINFNSKKSGAKDRFFANRAPLMQISERKRPVITENDATYTFKIAVSDTETKDLSTTKVYGSATSKCLVFLDNEVSASAYDWNLIGQKFDNEIYTAMTSAFGSPTDIDSNGKVVILYYNMGASETYTLGYFSSNDLTLGNGYNEMEVFYMNIKFGIEQGSTATASPLDPELIRTLAHEFQHLINHGQRVMIKKIAGMDSWMDEGMAESAEQLIGKTPGTGRIDTFKADSSNKIRNGASLCVWNQDDESYALSYTFMQYCKNHARDREEMFKLLIAHTYGDYRAIEDIMKNQNTAFTDFASIVTGYRIANLVNASSGIYGYGTENSIFNFSGAAYAPTSVDGVKLGAGGSIYIYPSDADVTSFKPSGQGSNIKFIRINK